MANQVIIFEDNDALRKGLEELMLLSDEFIVTGAYDNCITAAEIVRHASPDLVLMDIDMPGMTGIEAVKMIRHANLKVPILMLTVFEDNKYVFDAIRAGASGYLLKKHVSDRLIQSMKEVLSGGAPMSPSVAKMVISSMQQHSTGKQYQFTSKEKEILQLLCKGNSYKMIASETKLTFETIRSYVKKIYEKLQVHSATEAVSKAINERLV